VVLKKKQTPQKKIVSPQTKIIGFYPTARRRKEILIIFRKIICAKPLKRTSSPQKYQGGTENPWETKTAEVASQLCFSLQTQIQVQGSRC